MTIDFKKLTAPFPVEQIEWRVGATSSDKKNGLPLAYITARHVMDRLDEACGPFNWQIRHEAADVSGKVTAHISIKSPETGEWVSKSDGAGETDIEADKGSYSDATKRAAVLWGIGRYLYSVRAPWVSITQQGSGYKISDHEYERLYALLPTPDGQPVKGITVHSPSGLSKTPGAFWVGKDLNVFVKLGKQHKDAHGDPDWSDPEAIATLSDVMYQAINKAPNRLALTKLQADNLTWIGKHLDKADADSMFEAFKIRASQFDHQEKTESKK